MPTTVNTAFDAFLRDYVNLNPDETQKARGSRDWLLSQIDIFPNKNNSFPKLYSEKDIFFGSFARRTKKRILDDIDILKKIFSSALLLDELKREYWMTST